MAPKRKKKVRDATRHGRDQLITAHIIVRAPDAQSEGRGGEHVSVEPHLQQNENPLFPHERRGVVGPRSRVISLLLLARSGVMRN